MIISTAWIKEYTDLPNLSFQEIALGITLCVCEVEQVLPDPHNPNEALLDIDNKSLTHRPDLWGHYGMAREFSAVFKCPLKPLPFRDLQEYPGTKNAPGPVSVRVAQGSGCLGFEGLCMDNIKVGPSPAWMQQRLVACGLRSLNNITDISNYVMLETGMPLHIFDRAKIRGSRITVKPAQKKCALTTLDKTQRHIEPGDTLIYDELGPLSIPGVMGGLDSSVTCGTTQIFIEAANWDSVRVRQTSVRLGLRTDASRRYEKSLDSEQLKTAMFRAAALVMQLCPEARIMGNLESFYPEPQKTPAPITVTANHIREILGRDLDAEEISRILTSLDFGVTENKQGLSVKVPSFRATKDISCRADIVEEIGRITGYGNIAPKPPKGPVEPVRLPPLKKLERSIKDFLVLKGEMFEIMTHPLVGEALLKKAEWPDLNQDLVLANPISCEHDRVRPSLVPSMLEKAGINAKARDRFSMMETGRTYHPGEDFSMEVPRLCVSVYDRKTTPLGTLSGIIEQMAGFLGTGAALERPKGIPVLQWQGCYSAQVLELGDRNAPAGRVFTVHPSMLARFGIKGHMAMADINLLSLQALLSETRIRYRPQPPYPSSGFDCTVLAGATTCAADILKHLKPLTAQTPEITNLRIVDIFEINAAQKAVTLRITFKGIDRTLTGEWISNTSDKAVGLLEKAGFPLKQ